MHRGALKDINRAGEDSGAISLNWPVESDMPLTFRFFRTMAASAALAACCLASASPIIAPGSTYSYQVKQVDASDPSHVVRNDIRNITFDGIDEQFMAERFDGQQVGLTMSESQTDLGSGRWQVQVKMTTDGELFTLAGQWAFFFISGIGQDPLDVMQSVQVESAVLQLFTANHTPWYQPWDVGTAHPEWFAKPWDGTFINAGSGAGYNSTGNAGIREADITFIVSRVPEPGSMSLVALALAAVGLAGVRRRPTRT